MGEMVHVRLPEELAKDAKKMVEEGYFSTMGDLIRDVLRSAVFEYKKKKALYILTRDFGSLKGKIKRLTEEERRQLAEEYFKKDRSNIFREFGLE